MEELNLQRNFQSVLLYGKLPAAVTFDDNGLKGNSFKFENLQFNLSGSSMEVSLL